MNESSSTKESRNHFARLWQIALLVSVSFGAGYWFAKHEWGEILVALVVVLLGGGILAWRVKHHRHDDYDQWEP